MNYSGTALLSEPLLYKMNPQLLTSQICEFSASVVMLFHLFHRLASHLGDERFYSWDHDDHEARRSHPAEKGGAAEAPSERPTGTETGAESGP